MFHGGSFRITKIKSILYHKLAIIFFYISSQPKPQEKSQKFVVMNFAILSFLAILVSMKPKLGRIRRNKVWNRPGLSRLISRLGSV